MAIKLECSCGKRFSCGDEQEGRKVRCPACQGLVRVPGEAEERASYRTEKVVKCPKCKAEWPSETAVCVNCGWNFRTGKAMKTRYKAGERELASGGSTLLLSWQLIAERDEDGDVRIHFRRRLWGMTIFSSVWDLRGYTHLVTDFTAGSDDSPDFFYLDAEGPRKKPVRLYTGSNQETFHELIDALKEFTGMEVRRA